MRFREVVIQFSVASDVNRIYIHLITRPKQVHQSL